MCSQVTNRVLLIRPKAFSSNPETAADNVFQNEASSASSNDCSTQAAALVEFENLVGKLREAGVNVNVVDDTSETPDAVFPNNWIAFHEKVNDGGSTISLFPMKSPLRRKERRSDIVEQWAGVLGSEVKDYSNFEERGMFLEGTGSMVLDRANKIVYTCLSQRSNASLLQEFCQDAGFKLVSFHACSRSAEGGSIPIYHTNVMMQVGTTFAVICLESIEDDREKQLIKTSLENSGKELILVTLEQMSNYACNCLQLRALAGDGHILVMSTRAYNSLTPEQLAALARHSCKVVHSDLKTIECCGGGSARCMIAEIFPPQS